MQKKRALELLSEIRASTPNTRADCLNDKAVGCQCLSFSCKHNITGTIAYYDPVKAILLLYESEGIPVPNNELGRNPSHLRRNCVLDFTHDNSTYKPDTIAEILATNKGKISAVQLNALRKLSK